MPVRPSNVGAVVRGRPGRFVPGGRLGRPAPRPPEPGGTITRFRAGQTGRVWHNRTPRVGRSVASPRAAGYPNLRGGSWRAVGPRVWKHPTQPENGPETASPAVWRASKLTRTAGFPPTDGTGRVIRQNGKDRRVTSYKNPPGRVWHVEDPMSTRAEETLYMTAGEAKTFAADFSRTGAVVAGGVLSNPRVALTPADGGTPTASAETILAEPFVDSDGSIIETGKGFSFRLTGTGTKGEYDVGCKVDVAGGDTLELVCKLIVEDTITNG